MNKLWKKSLISFGVIVPIVTNTIIVTSCGKAKPSTGPKSQSWADFQTVAEKESATNIIKNSGMKEWQNDPSSNYSLGKFNPDNSKKIINISITNKLYSGSMASFQIQYNNVKYDVKEWKYNNDLTYKWSKNSAMPLDCNVTTPITKIDNTVYIGTNQHGLWSSTDKNAFVQNASIPINALINQIIKIDNTIYVGVSQTGLYSSTDAGKTFTKNKTIPNSVDITEVIKIDKVIYISIDQGGLYSSSDGKTFTKTSASGNLDINQIIKINDTIYIGTNEHGLWGSNDAGKTIDKIFVPFADFAITTITKIGNIIYLGTHDGLYNSTDAGKTFTSNKTIAQGIAFINQIIKIDNTIYITTSEKGLYVTAATDGKIFSQNTSIPAKINITQIAKINNIIYVGTAKIKNGVATGGLYSSLDGQTFTKNKTIPTNLNIGSITTLDNIIYINLNEGGLYSSSDGKMFTKNKIIPTNFNITQLAKIDDIIYVGTESGLWWKGR